MKSKPKILFLCDRRNWAFDFVAQNISSSLAGKYDFEIKYVCEKPQINESAYDLVWVFWWGERYHRKFLVKKHKIVKEISSHRWELDEAYGKHTPADAVERYLSDAGHVVVTSRRLLNLFQEALPQIHHYSLGIDASVFRSLRPKDGPIRFGWAGNVADPSKGVSNILVPACNGLSPLAIAPGNLSPVQMVNFYNDIDVICIASEGEGTPLPLLEAMACGCFPVSTDVGVAAELIRSGENGLIVARSREAFHKALQWCQDHPDIVRRQGAANIGLIGWERSLGSMSLKFDKIISSILTANETVTDSLLPASHSCRRLEPADPHPGVTLLSLLPEDKVARILVTSCRSVRLLRRLADMGYKRLICLDDCRACHSSANEELGDILERIELGSLQEFLESRSDCFDCIVISDAPLVLAGAGGAELLGKCYISLKRGGRLMACFSAGGTGVETGRPELMSADDLMVALENGRYRFVRQGKDVSASPGPASPSMYDRCRRWLSDGGQTTGSAASLWVCAEK